MRRRCIGCCASSPPPACSTRTTSGGSRSRRWASGCGPVCPGRSAKSAILQGRPELHAAYARLETAIRTGENAFEIELRRERLGVAQPPARGGVAVQPNDGGLEHAGGACPGERVRLRLGGDRRGHRRRLWGVDGWGAGEAPAPPRDRLRPARRGRRGNAGARGGRRPRPCRARRRRLLRRTSPRPTST